MKRGPYKKYLSCKVKSIVSRQTVWSQTQIRRQRNVRNDDDEMENENFHGGNMDEEELKSPSETESISDNQRHDFDGISSYDETRSIMTSNNLPSETESCNDTGSESGDGNHDESIHSDQKNRDNGENGCSKLAQLLEDPAMLKNLYPGTNVTVLLAMIMLSSFSARYGLTNDALQSLLDILTILLPSESNLPKTNYFSHKFLPTDKK